MLLLLLKAVMEVCDKCAPRGPTRLVLPALLLLALLLPLALELLALLAALLRAAARMATRLRYTLPETRASWSGQST